MKENVSETRASSLPKWSKEAHPEISVPSVHLTGTDSDV